MQEEGSGENEAKREVLWGGEGGRDKERLRRSSYERRREGKRRRRGERGRRPKEEGGGGIGKARN